ncbi:hypothetical protein [Amycolatopsis sp. NBC_01286]|uniref:hypothetical protein n=1 Tax=Amycolatopsis sp. NBC_01286 TaxID=2903560 RepID=UPI002E14F0E2|nr:hypothetical protein OG570_16900 [Amycolatopsis sp. NBC_01286]
MSAGNGRHLVDFIENVFGSSCAELGRRIAEHPHHVLFRKATFYEQMGETWLGDRLGELRAMQRPGQLWPISGNGASDPIEAARLAERRSAVRVGDPAAIADSYRRENQSLLLYAHGILIRNPLTAKLADADFLAALAYVCAIEPLVRAQIVRVFEPEPDLWALLAESEVLAEIISLVGDGIYEHSGERSRSQRAAKMVVRRLLESQFPGDADLTMPPGERTLYFQGRYDAAALDAIMSRVPKASGLPNAADSRLDQLVTLDLPGLDDITLTDMVHIRKDSSFSIFRDDIRSSLLDADDHLHSGDLRGARAVVAEHMEASLAQLGVSTRRGILGNAVVGDAFGWALGAVAAWSIAGLPGALATLAGKGVTELVRLRPSQSERALKAHYVALSKPGEQALAPQSFRELPENLWWGGNSTGEADRARQARDSLADFLEDW